MTFKLQDNLLGHIFHSATVLVPSILLRRFRGLKHVPAHRRGNTTVTSFNIFVAPGRKELSFIMKRLCDVDAEGCLLQIDFSGKGLGRGPKAFEVSPNTVFFTVEYFIRPTFRFSNAFHLKCIPAIPSYSACTCWWQVLKCIMLREGYLARVTRLIEDMTRRVKKNHSQHQALPPGLVDLLDLLRIATLDTIEAISLWRLSQVPWS